MRRRVAAVHAAAAALALAGLLVTVRDGVRQPAAALAFALLVAAGEAVRVRLPGGAHPVAPLATAAALGYALLGEVEGRPAGHGVLQVVAVTAAGTLAGSLPHLVRAPRPVRPDREAGRLLTAAFAAACYQPLHTWAEATGLGGPWHAPLVLLVLLLTAGWDAVLAAVVSSGRRSRAFPPSLHDALRGAFGLVQALTATGAVLALAVGAGGLWALPVCWVPLLLVQFAVRRHAAVRATYRQTIASLARATEVAGCTPQGHARRVAALSRAMARELGLAEPDLTVLEYAALMHDIGQLSLVDPLVGGATEPLEESERRRIALLGGAVVRQTGVRADVALVVERQADPWREQPLTARLVRVANAFEELTAGQDPVAAPLRALERLRLGAARDYDPRVVDALARVVAPDLPGPAAPAPGSASAATGSPFG
ncbi:HD domain-containing protein [Streptomyces sp. DSM 42041]|uniref:HD domain-containing protein n=1 Tax=Streptomyces hazeniae TaxID=3075538 RepID=A0ABU2NM64_9ACTN|nr:HD domain-containing protein [Streptomyces sp. DSM 42041]MDT0378076.1 HD domain-containing protein [Streptomyces sp. DSM 42041]